MRVLFLTYHFPEPDQAGAFRPWVEARLFQNMGCEVTVITSAVHYMTGEDQRRENHWCEEREYQGLRVLRVWAPGAHRSKIRSRIMNYLAYGIGAFFAGLFHGGRADVVFAGTDPVSVGPAAFMLSRLKRADLVLDERDLYPETAIALGVLKNRLLTRLVFKLQDYWRKSARGILAATPGIARTIKSYGHPSDKIGVLLNADPFLDNKSEPDKSQDLHSIAEQEVVVAYSGGLGQNNDVGTLLRAAGAIKNESSIAFAIIGEGECRNSYEKFCENNSISNVHFLGARPRQQARQMLSTADICVCLYHNGDFFKGTLASKIFDYLALGKPIIFAGSGDTAELLIQAGAAIVVSSGDATAMAQAIRDLSMNPRLRAELGDSGRRWYEENVDPSVAMNTLSRLVGLNQT